MAAPRAVDAEFPAPATPVPKGAEDDVVETTPAAVFEAEAADENDDRIAELADSASATGQTVYSEH